MDYKDTLNLPKTEFPMRGNLPKREPEMIERWEADKTYEALMAAGEGKETFILHDGPPYANGHIHMGHTINKVLKDIIVKMRSMQGFHSPYIPGWDCHGLPIEHQVDKELGKEKAGMSKADFRRYCRKYADKFVSIQRDEFKRLGIFGYWDAPYLTMSFDYEAQTVRELGKLMESGAVYQGKKPVYWCIDCGTALAEAEVEYADRKDLAITVAFPIPRDLGDIAPALKGMESHVVIWTTTPWTIPSNLAVALGPEIEYAAYELKERPGKAYILAKRLAPIVFEEMGTEGYKELAEIDPASLERIEARHPLYDRPSLIILGDHVTLDAGTGCVHTAPGHGQEDYEIGLKYGLEIYAPVNDEGKFTVDVADLEGVDVFTANNLVVERLDENGYLLSSAKVKHSYPHCWRCKKPVIFRSTTQWFVSMEKTGLREKALKEIDKVKWIPHWGRERIYGMIAARPDWCISRQRSWGVPIVAVDCERCGETKMGMDIAERAASYFEKEGADAWFERPVEDFLPEGTACDKCGNETFIKEEDILDVWFDSGVSFAAVMENNPLLSSPADLYLEGSDQHRGWFHSSLLASVGTRGAAPYRTVLTHGFVVDKNGRKMSKSSGNALAPEKIVKQRGAEVLRLWVAAEDYRDDIRVSEEILKRLEEAYRRIRNTCRFLLGTVSDFDPDKDAVPFEELWEIDRYALDTLNRTIGKALAAYDNYQFHTIFHRLHNYCSVDLSAFYLDILKDRLYTFPADSQGRRAAQTVLYEIVDKLTRIMAPILAFTSEEVWGHIPAKAGSVHLTKFPEVEDARLNDELSSRWEKLRELRKLVSKAAEEQRAAKVIGHSLDAKIILHVDNRWEDFLSPYNEELPFLFIVSQVELVESDGGDFKDDGLPGIGVEVARADGEKCQRCWNYSTSVGESSDHPEACARCVGHL